jgi:putative transposase
MRLLDEQYTRTPFYGMREMVVFLAEQGYMEDRKRVRRLMQLMGLETIYPKPHLSLPGEQSIRYPYLLRGVSIDRIDQVWIGVHHLHSPGARLSVSDGNY